MMPELVIFAAIQKATMNAVIAIVDSMVEDHAILTAHMLRATAQSAQAEYQISVARERVAQ